MANLSATNRSSTPEHTTWLVILLGASEFPKAPNLASAPAFARSHEAIRNYILDPQGFGLPSEALLLDLFDSPLNSVDIDAKIADWLKEQVAQAKEHGGAVSDLLLHYVGHGGFKDGSQDYCLALRSTRSDNPYYSSIPLESLSKTLRGSTRHARRYLILDACFAASAVANFQSGLNTVVEKQIEKLVWTEAPGPNTGTSLFCSSSKYSPSKFSDDGLTMFSDALLTVLREGRPDDSERLTLSDLAVEVTAVILHKHPNDGVRPEVHSPDKRNGDIAGLPIFKNPGFRASVPIRGSDIRTELALTWKEAQRDSIQTVEVEGRMEEVKVPPNVTDGHQLRRKGKGLPGINGGPAGDLLVTVKLPPKVIGDDIQRNLTLAWEEARQGFLTDVDVAGRRLKVVIPKGAVNGQEIRLTGQGAPGQNGGAPGDVVVRLKVLPQPAPILPSPATASGLTDGRKPSGANPGPASATPLEVPVHRSQPPGKTSTSSLQAEYKNPIRTEARSTSFVGPAIQVLIIVVVFVVLLFNGTRIEKVWQHLTRTNADGLREAVEMGNKEQVKYCLDQGVNPNVKDKDGTPVLIHAVRNSNIEKLLIDSGADVYAKNKENQTPLMFAASLGDQHAVTFILDKGADVNAKDFRNETALIWAARGGNENNVKLLLSRGADPNNKGIDGDRALDIAKKKGLPNIINLLKPNSNIQHSRTPTSKAR